MAAASGPALSLAAGDTVHAAGHLLLGMVAPLLLVLPRRITLALRALPVHRAGCHLYATGWGAGAQVTYYCSDVIGVALTALQCREWLAPARRPKLASSTAHQG